MSLGKFLLDLFYPPRCFVCNRILAEAREMDNLRLLTWLAEAKDVLCQKCMLKFPWIRHGCPRCAHPLLKNAKSCPWCGGFNYAFVFKDCCAVGRYEGELKDILYSFKYRGRSYLGVPLAKLLAAKIKQMPLLPTVEEVVPVPLCRQRLLLRGFNQSLLLARQVGKELGLPVKEHIQRIKETESQTMLNRRQRRENLRGAFICRGKLKPGSHILPIDDVFTTGSTANEASLVLKKKGAGRISVGVVARSSQGNFNRGG